jgi:hypothetical protein
MPHVSEFHVTPDHDGHDRLLVAALAAGDLTGADRDHALELTHSCAPCAELHDDLVAIARATAVVPPPIARRRDFQLSPADAARLRPAGWRRLLGGLAGASLVASRPLGVGLATLGLVGLLIGNVPIGSFGGAASSPGGGESTAARPAADPGQPGGAQAAPSDDIVRAAPAPAASAAASAAPAFGTEVGASPSMTPDRASAEYDASSAPTVTTGGGAGTVGQSAGGSSGKTTDVTGSPAPARDLLENRSSPDTNPFRPFNLVFVLAVLAGLGVLVGSRLRSRPGA